jgi:hypothetical protein
MGFVKDTDVKLEPIYYNTFDRIQMHLALDKTGAIPT